MTTKQQIEVILRIVIIFLTSLLVLTFLNGKLTLYMTVGALSVTYLILHYWRKRLLSIQNTGIKVK